jgi:hypothetical protein
MRIDLGTLLPYFGCLIRAVPDGIELTGASRNHLNAAALTPRTWRAPFTLHLVAKTDSTNLRLYWHLGEIILNWECSIPELRVHDPATGDQWGIQGQGFITPGEWHNIEWQVTLDSMRLTVDGRQRFASEGQYGRIEAPLAIGPCFGSTVTVKDLAVTPG